MPKVDNRVFYHSAIKKHGISAKGVQWSSKENQYKRFEILSSLIQDINRHTIVDAGCGFGDLYLYLSKIAKLPKKYIGIDIDDKMVQIAKHRTKQDIYHKDILQDDLPHGDYYIASGSLNILTKDETLRFISNAFKASQKGFVFNLLHQDSVKNHDIYNGLNPYDIFAFCTELNKNNRYIDGYLSGDFTIFMQK
jgi:SAM-dependent methyltransferase